MTNVSGAKLRRLRKDLGLSQEAVAFGAQAAGFKLSTAYYQKLEAGTATNVTLRTLDALRAAFALRHWSVLLVDDAA